MRLAYLQIGDPSIHFAIANDENGYDVVESDRVSPDRLLFRFFSEPRSDSDRLTEI